MTNNISILQVFGKASITKDIVVKMGLNISHVIIVIYFPVIVGILEMLCYCFAGIVITKYPDFFVTFDWLCN